MTLDLSSTAFKEGETIPKLYTGEGKDVSPPLRWAEPPAGTKSFALICDDPDAPHGTYTHWVLFNLPADTRKLDEGIPTKQTLDNGARQIKNDSDETGYSGPYPPPGDAHRYFFKVYALDTTLDLKAGASKADVVAAMKGHVLAEGRLMGRYQRQ
jgi:Raf kinase inhibitor-like YbhB/YbcL family protein